MALTNRLSSRQGGRSSWQRSGYWPGSKPDQIHVAAVCYRVLRSEPEFLLVRTRSGLWTFPKGRVDHDASNSNAAAREAYEEAGVKGRVENTPFVSYLHCKRTRLRSGSQVVMVDAYLCEVSRLVPPQERYRDPTWFCAAKAKQRLKEYRTPEYAAEAIQVIDRAMENIFAAAPKQRSDA